MSKLVNQTSQHDLNHLHPLHHGRTAAVQVPIAVPPAPVQVQEVSAKSAALVHTARVATGAFPIEMQTAVALLPTIQGGLVMLALAAHAHHAHPWRVADHVQIDRHAQVDRVDQPLTNQDQRPRRHIHQHHLNQRKRKHHHHHRSCQQQNRSHRWRCGISNWQHPLSLMAFALRSPKN